MGRVVPSRDCETISNRQSQRSGQCIESSLAFGESSECRERSVGGQSVLARGAP